MLEMYRNPLVAAVGFRFASAARQWLPGHWLIIGGQGEAIAPLRRGVFITLTHGSRSFGGGPMLSTISSKEERDFLIRIHFRNASDSIGSSIDCAYRDFNRTLRGISTHRDAGLLQTRARKAIREAISFLTPARAHSQDSFDVWHKDTCDVLRSAFGDDFHLYYGQAQKWINMSLKYLFILERHRIDPYWQYCHVPVDNILLERVMPHDPPRFGCRWSRIDSYERYLDFQSWFRDEFPGIPMDNEWRIWGGSARNESAQIGTSAGDAEQ